MSTINPVLVQVARVLQVDPIEHQKEVQKCCEHLEATGDGRHCDLCGKDLLSEIQEAV